MQAAGVRWRDYDRFIKANEKHIEDERLKRVPAALDLTPYRDEEDFEKLQALIRVRPGRGNNHACPNEPCRNPPACARQRGSGISKSSFERVKITDGPLWGSDRFTRSPADGFWQDKSGATHAEDVIAFEVMAESVDEGWGRTSATDWKPCSPRRRSSSARTRYSGCNPWRGHSDRSSQTPSTSSAVARSICSLNRSRNKVRSASGQVRGTAHRYMRTGKPRKDGRQDANVRLGAGDNEKIGWRSRRSAGRRQPKKGE